MPDNNPNIPIPTGEWVDLYALTGITVGEPLHIKNIGVSDIFLAVQAAKPDNDHAAYDVIERNDDIGVTNNSGDSGAWAFSNATKGLISVKEREGFQPVLDITSKTGIGAGINIDAIGIQRVSRDYSLFSSYFTFDVPPSKWFIRENGVEVRNDLSTKVISSNGVLVQSSGATPGDISINESRRHPRYQPNRGLRISESIGFKDANLDGILKAGLFVADENGAYFKTKGDGKLYAVILNDGVETKEEEIIFPFDIDITKGNVYSIQIQWHGVATVRYYVNNPSTGFPQLVHIYNFLNVLDEAAYFVNPSLSASFSAENVTEEVSFWCGSLDVTSEGGQRDRMQYGSDSASVTVTSTTNNGIIAMRSPHVINSNVNTRDMRLVRVSVQAGGKCKLRLYKTRDLTAVAGGTFDTPVFGSFVEFNKTMTSVDPAKMAEFLTIPLATSQFKEISNPDKDIIDFIIIHGDIIVLSIIEGNNIEVDATIEYGEEI